MCENSDEFKFDMLDFKVESITLSKMGPFSYFSINTWRSFVEFDVVIGLFSLRNISNVLTSLNPFRRYKFIYWGIGVSASYTKPFDKSVKTRLLMMLMSLPCDAMIFYSSYPLRYYKKIKNTNSLFVADNTVQVTNPMAVPADRRNEFLFIGTLYKQKGLESLIENYHKAYTLVGDDLPILKIVGDGDLSYSLKQMVVDLNLEDKVHFLGAIYESKAIENCFSRAILCVSPRQAGLSVLTSMAYSVPFVTTKRAYTGGEIFNIVHDVTGLLLENETQISDVFCDAAFNRERYAMMGERASELYRRNRTGIKMSEKIYDAICYAASKSR